jgi:hypothetical protein
MYYSKILIYYEEDLIHKVIGWILPEVGKKSGCRNNFPK